MAPKLGRPQKFTKELQDEFLERLANGESARAICRSDHMPHWSNFCRFKRAEENKIFRDQYARSWEDGLTAWEHEIDEIASNEARDLQPDGKGGYRSDNTFVNRDRLRIDTKKWIMSKRMPHIYGEKVQTELTGKDGGPIQFTETVDRPRSETPEEWQIRVTREIQARKTPQIVQ